MTVAFDLRPYPPELAREDVRRGLTAMLRRRVPSQEVDDIAQTILCDALASGSIPSDPEEMRRWLVGIARHKIADYHRGAARTSKRSEGDAPLATCAARPVAFEEREVLDRLLGAVASRRDAETMDWLVREHGGERLMDIAKDENLPAPAVRQRVSRLRRALRSRWAGVIALLVLIATGASLGLSDRTQPPPAPAIVPDRAQPLRKVDSPVDRLPIADDLAGDWVVQAVHPDRELSAAEQKFVDTYAKIARAHVEAGRITITAPGFDETWTIASADAHAVTVLSPEGSSDAVDIKLAKRGVDGASADRLELRAPGHPRLAGRLVLKRPIY